MTGFLTFEDGHSIAVRDGLTLGRTQGCDVVIEDHKVSRRHARLIVAGGVVEIEDLGSSNGTLLNGRPVKRRLLRDGDRIQLGRTKLTFAEEAREPQIPEPQIPEPTGGAPRLEPGPKPLEGDPFLAMREPAPAPEGREVLEFADEVVELRPHRQEPASGGHAPTRPAPGRRAPTRQAPTQQAPTQQAPTQQARGGLLRDDLAQMSSGLRALLVILAIVLALAAGYVAMRLVSG